MMIAQSLSSQTVLRGSPLASRPQQRQSQAAPMRMAPVAAKVLDPSLCRSSLYALSLAPAYTDCCTYVAEDRRG
jgi:hypothetical protein